MMFDANSEMMNYITTDKLICVLENYKISD